MALNIRNAQAERLAARVVTLTGETKTAAVTQALRERLERLERAPGRRRLADDLNELIEAVPRRRLSAASLVELSIVIEARHGLGRLFEARRADLESAGVGLVGLGLLHQCRSAR